MLLSVTEGEDKPLKYPTIFNTADVAVVTKMRSGGGRASSTGRGAASIQAVRPGMQVFEVSAKTGEGMDGVAGVPRGQARKSARLRACR